MLCRHGKEASKLLLGFNFYGNDYTLPQSGNAVVGHEYLQLLNTHKPEIKWDRRNKEHFLEYHTERLSHKVYYPTTVSMSKRCDLAEETGVGVAIWELGQGLEQFFELL